MFTSCIVSSLLLIFYAYLQHLKYQNVLNYIVEYYVYIHIFIFIIIISFVCFFISFYCLYCLAIDETFNRYVLYDVIIWYWTTARQTIPFHSRHDCYSKISLIRKRKKSNDREFVQKNVLFKKQTNVHTYTHAHTFYIYRIDCIDYKRTRHWTN